jgi:hypothetical protein
MTITAERFKAEKMRRARPRWFELEPDVLLWPVGPPGSGKVLVIRLVR